LGGLYERKCRGKEGARSMQGIFLSNPNGTFSTVVDNASGEFDAFFDPSLNVFGRVAFQAFKTVAGEQVIGIFTSRGGPVTTVADNSGRFGPAKSFSSFGEPSLNDVGLVAFTADTNTFCSPEDFLPEQGVFTAAIRTETRCCRPATPMRGRRSRASPCATRGSTTSAKS
jgi:hypothetical protein